jgi:hypothetical protein
MSHCRSQQERQHQEKEDLKQVNKGTASHHEESSAKQILKIPRPFLTCCYPKGCNQSSSLSLWMAYSVDLLQKELQNLITAIVWFLLLQTQQKFLLSRGRGSRVGIKTTKAICVLTHMVIVYAQIPSQLSSWRRLWRAQVLHEWTGRKKRVHFK